MNSHCDVTLKKKRCKEGVSKRVHLLDLHEMTTNFLRQLRLWSSIPYILPSTSCLKSWGMRPTILGMWQLFRVTHILLIQRRWRKLYSQDVVCRNGHSCFSGVVKVGAKSQHSLPHRKRSNTVMCMLTY